jgi:hypothetical protein
LSGFILGVPQLRKCTNKCLKGFVRFGDFGKAERILPRFFVLAECRVFGSAISDFDRHAELVAPQNVFSQECGMSAFCDFSLCGIAYFLRNFNGTPGKTRGNLTELIFDFLNLNFEYCTSAGTMLY